MSHSIFTKKLHLAGISIFVLLFFLSACTVHEVEVQSVDNFSVEKMSTDGIAIGMDVKINNPNGFSIKLKAIDVDLYVKNDFLATTKLVKPVKIKAKSNQSYHLVISDKNGSLNKKIIPKLMLNGLTGGKIPIRYKGYIKGKVFIFGKKIPLEGKEDFEW